MREVVLEGIAVKGLGEGAYFMSKPYYKSQFKKLLGFEPYPGTLNLKVTENEFGKLKQIKKLIVPEHKKGDEMNGEVACYKAKINNVSGAVIIPKHSSHKDTLEVIAPVHLRTEFGICDGDRVKAELK